MNSYVERLKANLQDSIATKKLLLEDEERLQAFGRAVDLVVTSYRRNGRLYIAGNGGSAADAQHLSTEFVSKLARPRAPLPAEALTTDTSLITAIGNDYGFDQVFARQIQAKMRPEDVFMGITTSGVSVNIVRALEKCREMGFRSIVFAGRDGGVVKGLADICIIAPGGNTNVIQEVHICMYHTLCGAVEAEMFPL